MGDLSFGTKDYYEELNRLLVKMKSGNGYVSVSDLAERFEEIDKEYKSEPWNLMQILTNINIFIPADVERGITLLKATRELLNKQNESCYVLNLLDETVYYDDCDCDGNCLLDDIETLLVELDVIDYDERYSL